MPQVTVRHFAPNRLHELEQRTLEHFATAHGFHEIQGFLWYDEVWLDQLGVDPGGCVELANPPAAGLHLMRKTLLPGMLGAVSKNRFHFPALSLMELGSVFHPAVDGDGEREFRHIALVLAARGKGSVGALDERLRTALTGWAWSQFGRAVRFREATAAPERPWEHPDRTARVLVDGTTAGRISVVDLPLRRAMDEHLGAWSIVWAELWLSHVQHLEKVNETLGAIPAHPLAEMDFCLVVPRLTRSDEVVAGLSSFEHKLLRSIRYISSFESKMDVNRRRVTFRTVIGDESRTLVDADLDAFRAAFERHVADCGYEILTA
jgi:phenylalanyl-tRNA synthetase beta subunit